MKLIYIIRDESERCSRSKTEAGKDFLMNKWIKALLFLVGAAILTRLIPFSSWFRILDTMIHELGHALMTLLMSGRVLSIELNPDHSGVTYSMLSSGAGVLSLSRWQGMYRPPCSPFSCSWDMPANGRAKA